MAPRPERIFGVLAKIESVPLTDAAPTGVDALRPVGIPLLKMGFLEPGLRDDVVTGQLGAAERAIPAGRWGTIDITLEVRGAGAAYSATVVPEADVLLRICGMGKTLNATGGSESIRYTTLDTGAETATVWCYSRNKLFKLVGCVATMRLSAEAAKRGLMTFTITGKMVADPTEASLIALSPLATIPPLFHTVATTIGSWTSASGTDPLVLKSLGLDLGNTVTDRASAGAADGLAGYFVSDRKVRQEMTVETPNLAQFDLYAATKLTGASNPLSTWQIGQLQYNRMLAETGRWALEAPDPGSVGALSTEKLSGNLIIGAAPTSLRELNLTFS
jgi:hypothetical protein